MKIPSRRLITLLAVVVAGLSPAWIAETRLLSRWAFGGENPGANSVEGAPQARVDGATTAKGRPEEGGGDALAFEDWSVRNYLKPDPRQASRVVVEPAGDATALFPAIPFTVSAWIYPTADPVYYGGIIEKGRGYGSSYRLLLLRGLKLQASLGPDAVVRSPAPLTLNEWHEVGFQAQAEALVLLVDGKEVARTPIGPSSRKELPDPVLIGERFTGRIDEVSIRAD